MVSDVQGALGAAIYPFEHVKGRLSLVDYARAKQFDANPARMAQLEAHSHLQMLFGLYYRLLGRLVEVAVQVEEKLL